MSDDAIITRLELLRKYLEDKLDTSVYKNPDEKYVRVTYDGKSVCRIYIIGNGYNVEYSDSFLMGGCASKEQYIGFEHNIPVFIRNRIDFYKEKEVKNMAKRRFIVEKMEVKMNNFGPDVINMTVRKEPDGIPFKTGRELRTLIESLDPDKLSDDSRIAVDIDVSNKAIERSIYMMTARGSGKTRWISEMFKNSFPFKDHIKDVIFNDPATIVFWTDGTKTVVKCQPGETFDPEKGLAMAISKKVLGNDYGYYETFAKHVGRYNKKHKEN